jgi:hypothetical protein
VQTETQRGRTYREPIASHCARKALHHISFYCETFRAPPSAEVQAGIGESRGWRTRGGTGTGAGTGTRDCGLASRGRWNLVVYVRYEPLRLVLQSETHGRMISVLSERNWRG